MRSPSFIAQERFDVSADALLISSGLYAAAAAVILPVWWFVSGKDIDPATPGNGVVENSALAGAIVVFLLIAGFWVGPAIAWALHGRRQRPRLFLAPVVSPIIVLVLAGLGPIFAGLYQWMLSPLTQWDYAGAALAFGMLGSLHMLLVIHAARGIRPRVGDSDLLRSVRIAAVLALCALTAVIGGALYNGYDSTVIQALLFILAIGYAAGLTTHIAAALDDMEVTPA